MFTNCSSNSVSTRKIIASAVCAKTADKHRFVESSVIQCMWSGNHKPHRSEILTVGALDRVCQSNQKNKPNKVKCVVQPKVCPKKVNNKRVAIHFVHWSLEKSYREVGYHHYVFTLLSFCYLSLCLSLSLSLPLYLSLSPMKS